MIGRNLKSYVEMLYEVTLTAEQENGLIDYLFEKSDEIHDVSEFREYIYKFVETLYDISPAFIHANDNSDLKQMLFLIKAKSDAEIIVKSDKHKSYKKHKIIVKT